VGFDTTEEAGFRCAQAATSPAGSTREGWTAVRNRRYGSRSSAAGGSWGATEEYGEAGSTVLDFGSTVLSEGDAERTVDDRIGAEVEWTPFIDTHEHLVEESARTNWEPGHLTPCDDWSVLLSHYIDSDLVSAGMPAGDQEKLHSPDTDPIEKWSLVAPYWPAVKNTGYGQAVRASVERLYDVPDLDDGTVGTVAERYRATVKPGYYERVLRELAGVESCQVDPIDGSVYRESRLPTLLMQDISLITLHMGSDCRRLAGPAGIEVRDLADYHSVVDWWFSTYGPYATAVKSQAAYSRGLDFEDVPAERAEEPFKRQLDGDVLSAQDTKLVQDHLFWYGARKAGEYNLPVKLHTGYYAGNDGMPIGRPAGNPAEVCELLRKAPDITFVLMHVCYPFHEQMIAIAKHWHNAVIDMCWAWIINPTAASRFLRDFIVTAPANKLLTFGGDYIPVELVIGHAAIARQGIASVLTDLVADEWLSAQDAVDLIDPIMHGNARRIFNLAEKAEWLAKAPWVAW